MDNGQERASKKSADELDLRMYLPQPEGWSARIKQDSTKEYCHQQRPGDDFFHLLIIGEVYLQCGDAKYCLNCAMRTGITTSDRLHWQNKRRPRGTAH